MVKDRTANNTAPNDNGLGMGTHLENLSFDVMSNVCKLSGKR